MNKQFNAAVLNWRRFSVWYYFVPSCISPTHQLTSIFNIKTLLMFWDLYVWKTQNTINMCTFPKFEVVKIDLNQKSNIENVQKSTKPVND